MIEDDSTDLNDLWSFSSTYTRVSGGVEEGFCMALMDEDGAMCEHSL